jgi:alpha-L-rhamnosidase
MACAVVALTALFVSLSDPAMAATAGKSPDVNPALRTQRWPAFWIAHAGASPFAYGVYHFRKSFDLPSKPATFVVHISADNRYRLFVNGEFAAAGPAQSDLRNWRFESVDLSPHLKAGRNVLAAVVWNGGEYRPMAQISDRTGFLLQSGPDTDKAVNTGAGWKTFHDEAYSPIAWRDNDPKLMNQYYVAGGMERVDGARYPWGWELAGFDDSSWTAARVIVPGAPSGVESHQKWQLVPSPVPLLSETDQRFARVARAEGVTPAAAFLSGTAPLEIAAHSRATILLDQAILTTGYPEIVVSGGTGATVRVVYSEALYGENRIKGNRNQIEEKRTIGVWDEFLPDGGKQRTFRPLWTRSWRYVELQILAGAEPLTIDDVRSQECRFPAERSARFQTNRPVLTDIWEAGWRTLALSAQDVFVSDLYWERIQYIGDTKLQALAWMAASGDEKLFRQALNQFDASRAPFGLTQSRFPADLEQYTPLYSLAWVTMVHDFWMYRHDDAFLRQFLPGIRQVLDWYGRQKTREGLIPPLFHLDFVDSSYGRQWHSIVQKEGQAGMTIHSLLYAMALDDAAGVYSYFGREAEGREFRREATEIKQAVRNLCWDERRQVFADTPSKQFYSQQANILAVLTDVIPAAQQAGVLERAMADTTIAQIQMYFRFYLGRALNKVGQGDRYVDNLGPWERMIADGMTTFGEIDGNPRSECHPWSATPVYEFLTTVAGIQPAEPGFKSVRIAPAMGSLTKVDAAMPHPDGLIEVVLERRGESGLKASVRLPKGLKGTFVWRGRSVAVEGNRELSF